MMSEKLRKILDEEISWRILFSNIYKVFLKKSIILLDGAKGLTLVKDVYTAVREIVEADRQSYKEILTTQIHEIETRLEEKIDFFKNQLKWTNEQFAILAKSIGKPESEIKSEYNERVKQALSEAEKYKIEAEK